jgi:hypothetical protein
MLERPAFLGQLVLHANRRLRDHRPGDDALALELAQAFRQHPIADIGDGRAQFGEAQAAVEQQLNDRTGPAPADELDGLVKSDAQVGFETHACIVP